MKVRRHARAAVLQALYELDFTDQEAKSAISARFEDRSLPEAAQDFARSLVMGVQTYRIYLDSVVGELAPEWPIEQIARIDRNILRLSLWELSNSKDVPPKVVINEAVELAKKAVMLTPRNGNFWNTLGVAQVRAGEYQAAIQSLGNSMELKAGGNAVVPFRCHMHHRKIFRPIGCGYQIQLTAALRYPKRLLPLRQGCLS